MYDENSSRHTVGVGGTLVVSCWQLFPLYFHLLPLASGFFFPFNIFSHLYDTAKPRIYVRQPMCNNIHSHRQKFSFTYRQLEQKVIVRLRIVVITIVKLLLSMPASKLANCKLLTANAITTSTLSKQ